MTDVDLADVQGLIIRGYMMPVVRHLGLRVNDAVQARSFLGEVVDEGSGLPTVTTAAPWATKPDLCLNLGLTFAGLSALGVAAESLASFPVEFAEGPIARAVRVGDTGPSAPENWRPWTTDPGLHLLVSLFGQTHEAVERATQQVASRWRAGWRELGRGDGHALPTNLAHFGYRDGLSQPTIQGVPLAGLPDHLPRAPLGEFLLGHPSQHTHYTYPVPEPRELGRNGSFAAFRILAQDVDAFAGFLQHQAASTGLTQELIAAKLCGRWRNGTPLVLSPETDSPNPPIPPEAMNDFDYVGDHDDARGYRCPVGAHVRRMYPRSGRVAGNGGHLHRVVRRGMTYGPPHVPEQPNDGHERGLLGLFIGVSLRDQFEFLMADWANDGMFAPGLGRTKDPLLGANETDTSRFVIPTSSDPVVLDGFARFVTTKGAAYCFLPSLTAIRFLAASPPDATRAPQHQ